MIDEEQEFTIDEQAKPQHYTFDGMDGLPPHGFLSEELLTPRACSCDTQRLNMFSNHISQLVHLKTPELPKVFTNFENQVGKYSVAYKKADTDTVIVDKIRKNACTYMVITRDANGLYDIYPVRAAVNVTEEYGYAIEDKIANKEKGDIIRAGEFITSTSFYDDDSNFRYGVNLKACYLPWNGMTMEDAIVISESAAERLTSYKVENTSLVLNRNCLLLNLYGDDTRYQGFPAVGEEIKDSVLCSVRQIQYAKSLFDLRDTQLRQTGPNDKVFHCPNGTVVDIDIYNNLPYEQLKNNVYSEELYRLFNEQLAFYSKLHDVLSRIINNENNRYTSDVAYWAKRSVDYRDETKSWKYQNAKFEGVMLKFTILKENRLNISAKLTGRYGNKGVISKIIPDAEMPHTKDGFTPDVLLNPLGVINRINPAQLHEQHINWMSDNLVREIKKYDDVQKQFDEILWFITKLNPNEGAFIKAKVRTIADKREYVKDTLKTGVYIHQPPFFGVVSMETLVEMFKEKPYLCKKYKFEGVEGELVVGDLYFIRLKHESSNKFSARSTFATNIKQSPAKSASKKKSTEAYAHTPVRIGEMETTNLLITKDGDAVSKMLRTYSSSERDRMKLVQDILTAKDPLRIKTELVDNTSANKKILNAYLYVLGLELKDSTVSDMLSTIYDTVNTYDEDKAFDFDELGELDDDLELELDSDDSIELEQEEEIPESTKEIFADELGEIDD